MIQFTPSQFRKLVIAFAVYITSLIAANTLGIKLMPFLFGGHLSVAVFSFPFVFLTTDVVGEVFGKKIARLFVLGGFITTVLFILYMLVSFLLPWSKDALWVHDSYNQIFGVTVRISIASILAFAIAEYQDVFTFFFFKKNFGDKAFWLRSTLSNLWSQLLDSAIFMVVAFAGIYSPSKLFSIVITWWLYKVLMGLLYTPLSYVGIYLLKDKSNASNTTENSAI
jgi:uncharacterized integral membrane protein (TIGR00697 family)